MIDWLVRLYPKAWRARYGVEFRALLEDRPPGLFEVLDIMRNAGEEHMKTGWLGIRLGAVLATLSPLMLWAISQLAWTAVVAITLWGGPPEGLSTAAG